MSPNVFRTARVGGGAIVFFAGVFFGVFFDGCEVDVGGIMGFIAMCLRAR